MVEYPVIQVKFNFLGSHVGEKKNYKIAKFLIKKNYEFVYRFWTSTSYFTYWKMIFFFPFPAKLKRK